MNLTIYSNTDTIRCTIIPSDASSHHQELMVDDYYEISFNSQLISFAVGDYIIIDNNRYVLVDVAKPISEGGRYYAYTLQFHAEWLTLQNKVLFYSRQNGYESAWSMTNRMSAFLAIVVDNIKRAGLGGYTYSIDASLSTMKHIQFDGTNILDALTLIAQAWECEWWIDSNIIFFGTCRNGTAVPLRVGEAIANCAQSASQSEYCNRLYAFGSTRNLPTNYRQTSNTTIDGVVQRRLQLPIETPYIGSTTLSNTNIIEAIKVFEDVYPHTDGKISSIATKEYYDEVEDADGNVTTEKWLAYRFADANLNFSNDYRLAGQDLSIQFTSGMLAGMTFVVEFNPDGNSPETQIFEIIRNEDYGIPLPNDKMKPSVGDKYVLAGWDATKIADLGLIAKAESELKAVAQEWFDKQLKSQYNYDCDTNPIWCAGYRDNNGEWDYNPADVCDFGIGQLVRIYDDGLFGVGGNYEGRIRAYTKNLINPYKCSYTIGDSPNYSLTSQLQQQVESAVKVLDPSAIVSGATKLIKRYDSTPESDSTAYSSLRSKIQFLDKTKLDTAYKGMLSNLLQSTSFASGFGGFGYTITNKDGKSYLEIDEAYIRKKATFETLDIRKITHSGGVQILSPSSCTIARVEGYRAGTPIYTSDGLLLYAKDGQLFVRETNPSAYICYFRATDGDKTITNDWRVGDFARCQTYNLTQQRMYWRKVIEVSTEPVGEYHYIVLSLDDCLDGSDVPMVGDEVVVLGSDIPDRQNAVIIASNGNDSPYYMQLKNISRYEITDANIVTLLSPNKNLIRGSEIELLGGASLAKVYGSMDLIEGVQWEIEEFSNQEYDDDVIYARIVADSYALTFRTPEGARIKVNCPVILFAHDGDYVSVQECIDDGSIADPNATTIYGGGCVLPNPENDYDRGLQLPANTEFVTDEGWLCVNVLPQYASDFALSYLPPYVSAESRIKQTKEAIELSVGATGVNIQKGLIELNGKTKIKDGDNSETLIEGGKIRSKFIEVDLLKAVEVETIPPSQQVMLADGTSGNLSHIKIKSNYLQMFNPQGEMRCLIHGNELSELGGESSNTNIGGQTGAFTESHTDITIATFTTSANNNAVSIPSISVNLSMSNDSGDDATHHIRAYLLVDNQEYAYVDAYELSQSNPYQLSFEAFEGSFVSGPHEVVIRLANYTPNGDIIYYSFGTGVIRISYPQFLTEIANNGFRSSMSSEKYMICQEEKIEMRFGNYIFRMSSSGIQKSNDGGTNFTNI